MVSMSLILDRRVRDTNGHMHVADCVITRGIVSEYFAHEIDGAVERGHHPNSKLAVYRDPAALKMALDSMKDIPMMHTHHVVSASDPKKEHIIGTISNPRMRGDDAIADLTFWSAEDGIDPVMDSEMEELSLGYTCDIDWTPGEVNGLHYVARMHTINANHLALVPRGRTPGSRVADQKPSEPVMTDKSKFPKIAAAFAAVFGLKPEQTVALDAALYDELGETEVIKTPEQIEADRVAAETAEAAKIKVVVDAAIAEAIANKDEEIKTAVDSAVKEVHDLYAAREAVSNKVGMTTLDSAEATYRFALDKSGVEHKTLVADALPALWEVTNKVKVSDSAPVSEIDVPNLFNSHIRKG